MLRFLYSLGVIALCALVALAVHIHYVASIAGIEARHAISVIRTAPTAVRTLGANQSESRNQPNYQSTTVVIDRTALSVQIADTDALRELGLGDRSSLAADTGMLFVFPQAGAYAFWMKDMSFPLDIIWISSAHQIVYIAPDVSPSSYPHAFVSKSPAQYVLEVNAGYAAEHSIAVGDAVEF